MADPKTVPVTAVKTSESVSRSMRDYYASRCTTRWAASPS